MKKLLKNWYWILVAGFLLAVGLVYLVIGEKSYIAVHDNLDLFTAQYKMMKDTNTFFAHHVNTPFLGGISRDNLPSELALTSLLYVVFPMFAAYVINYLLKVLIAVLGSFLLAREIYGKEGQETYLAVLCGLAYGMLNLFPNFGIPFASLPLIVYLLLKVDRAETWKKSGPWILAVFAYPFVSYFSYLGLFLCGYVLVAVIWVSLYRKRFAGKLCLALLALAIGYLCFEYRLFSVMLFGEETTIRTLMVGLDLSLGEALQEACEAFTYGMMHVESLHHKWVMPLCLVYFVGLNLYYLWIKNWKRIFHDYYNLLVLFMVCNALIYGLYDMKALRNLVGTLLPPLDGWQFNRTLFFNPCLWYMTLFVLLYRMVKGWHSQKVKALLPQRLADVKWMNLLWTYLGDVVAVGILFIAMMITVFTDTRYNDLLHTCYRTALHELKDVTIDNMNYVQFYGEKEFAKAKEEIGYQGEWAVAYGLHPAVLEYNGIATLDGYLGYYSVGYKEKFRKMIAPALERVEGHRINFDNWGARAYLYPGDELPVVSECISYGPFDDYHLYLDIDAFHELGGTYIFSRIPIDNEKDLGVELVNIETSKPQIGYDENRAYTIYVYR